MSKNAHLSTHLAGYHHIQPKKGFTKRPWPFLSAKVGQTFLGLGFRLGRSKVGESWFALLPAPRGGVWTLRGCLVAPIKPSIWHPLEGPGVNIYIYMYTVYIYYILYMPRWSNLTHIFQLSWNHQLVHIFIHILSKILWGCSKLPGAYFHATSNQLPILLMVQKSPGMYETVWI